MIDSATWTGRPSAIAQTDAPYGGEWSEADDAEYARELGRQDRRDRLRAIGMLIGLTGERGDEWTVGAALLCIVALILDRYHNEDRHGRACGCDMGHFDYEKLYAGWQATIVHQMPRLRFRIEHDGDWDM
jgi:hypothetical protein